MMEQNCEIGIVGLGVMGRNFLLNLASHDFNVAGYDIDINKVNSLRSETKDPRIHITERLEDFIGFLRRPRAVMMLVPAGAPVDSVIASLMDHLRAGDLIIDAGNSYFKDTDLRTGKLAEKDIRFMGTGLSGGEEGARLGPSIMPGGLRESWERVRPVFVAAAARVNGFPCVTYLGSGSAGHFVKMVHNGIEYGMMQLIAETYDLMKRCLGFNDDQLHDIYNEWNEGELNSYLIGITSDIFAKTDEKTGKRLINEILDIARQKGTGMWTSQSAMELQVPIPTIDAAVSMRYLSAFKDQRHKAGKIFQQSVHQFKGDRKSFLSQLKNAFYTAMIITYSQGMALLTVASDKYKYGLNLKDIASIWRGGCVIRAELLNDIYEAFSAQRDLPNLLLDQNLSAKIIRYSKQLREIVSEAAYAGVPVPALMASLGYLDAIRSERLPANLVQAQRDYFGSHTYERDDAKGTFHTEWLNSKVYEKEIRK
jgi:6-phosphogluconate dehydrogenase